MKTIIFAILMTGLLSACASAPKPKQPSDFNREPVNKTVNRSRQNSSKATMRKAVAWNGI